jgi:L-ascorbate metabolism protein UlaG (beta-lactamase superfamily)
VIWHGHSCVELRGKDGTVVIDPFTGVPGFDPLKLKADLVLATHEHGDHNYFTAVELSGRETNIQVETIESFHDDRGGSLRGTNKIFIVTLDDIRIAHFGDLGTDQLTDEQLSRLKALDVLFIPVGGYYTIDGPTAAKLVKQLRPDLTIPIHYRSGKFDYEQISEVTPFTDQFNNVVTLDTNRFKVGDYHNSVLVLKIKQ